MRAAFIVSVLSFSAATACSAADVATSSSESYEEIGHEIQPVDLVRCWIIPDTAAPHEFFAAHAVRCSTAIPEGYPLVPSDLIVGATNSKGDSLSSIMMPGEEKELGKFYADTFPIKITFRAIFGELPRTFGDNLHGIWQTIDVKDLTEATPEKPAAMRTPFALWPVDIRDGDLGQVGSYSLRSDYTVSVAPSHLGANPEPTPLDSLGIRMAASSHNKAGPFLMIAPTSGAISAELTTDLGKSNVTIDGPGTYQIENGALSRVSATTTPIVIPDAGPSTVDAAIASTDAGPPPCGVDGQIACLVHGLPTCDTKMRLANDICHACGADGQIACLVHGLPTCDTGLTVKSNICSK